jgi:hypothetical protein
LLELFLALIDRMLALAKTRSESKDKWLEVITALHSELIQIHSNYLSFFEQARLDLARGTSVREVLERLKERRLELEAARRSLRAVGKELAVAKAGSAFHRVYFFAKLSEYLSAAADGPVHSSAALNVVDRMETALSLGHEEKVLADDFQHILAETLSLLRTRFDDVASAYGSVKAQSL